MSKIATLEIDGQNLTSCYRRYEVVAVDINKLRDLSE
jgi:hypothetical protein